jgi:hypothetical protein
VQEEAAAHGHGRVQGRGPQAVERLGEALQGAAATPGGKQPLGDAPRCLLAWQAAARSNGRCALSEAAAHMHPQTTPPAHCLPREWQAQLVCGCRPTDPTWKPNAENPGTPMAGAPTPVTVADGLIWLAVTPLS